MVKDHQENIITDPNAVSKSLVDHLRKNDNRFQGREYKNWNVLPSLPEPTEEELIEILHKVSRHRALTSFSVPDEYIKFLLDNDLSHTLAKLWDPNTLTQFPEVFDCELIPLNKVHPQVPTTNQMRLIVATNVLFKVLELRFSDELHHKFWDLRGFVLSQLGFLRHTVEEKYFEP